MSDAGVIDEPGLAQPVAVGPGAGDADPVAAGGPGGEEPPLDGFRNGATGPDRGPHPESGAPVDGAAADPVPAAVLTGPDASLLALIDRLAGVLERSDLGELEVAAGGTAIVLRSPSAIARPMVVAPGTSPEATAEAAASTPVAAAPTPPAQARAVPAARPSVRAPLTGIFYGAPSPGAMPYVAVGDHVAVGQIIGLIEAMKLFNEIKSDQAGRVVRVCVESGALVKANQPLIEVERA